MMKRLVLCALASACLMANVSGVPVNVKVFSFDGPTQYVHLDRTFDFPDKFSSTSLKNEIVKQFGADLLSVDDLELIAPIDSDGEDKIFSSDDNPYWSFLVRIKPAATERVRAHSLISQRPRIINEKKQYLSDRIASSMAEIERLRRLIQSDKDSIAILDREAKDLERAAVQPAAAAPACVPFK